MLPARLARARDPGPQPCVLNGVFSRDRLARRALELPEDHQRAAAVRRPEGRRAPEAERPDVRGVTGPGPARRRGLGRVQAGGGASPRSVPDLQPGLQRRGQVLAGRVLVVGQVAVPASRQRHDERVVHPRVRDHQAPARPQHARIRRPHPAPGRARGSAPASTPRGPRAGWGPGAARGPPWRKSPLGTLARAAASIPADASTPRTVWPSSARCSRAWRRMRGVERRAGREPVEEAPDHRLLQAEQVFAPRCRTARTTRRSPRPRSPGGFAPPPRPGPGRPAGPGSRRTGPA